jgi:hypothetical protein
MPHREPALLHVPAPAHPKPPARQRGPDTWQRVREDVAILCGAPESAARPRGPIDEPDQ